MALISRVASTSSSVNESLTRMASTMTNAQSVREGVGESQSRSSANARANIMTIGRSKRIIHDKTMFDAARDTCLLLLLAFVAASQEGCLWSGLRDIPEKT